MLVASHIYIVKNFYNVFRYELECCVSFSDFLGICIFLIFIELNLILLGDSRNIFVRFKYLFGFLVSQSTFKIFFRIFRSLEILLFMV